MTKSPPIVEQRGRQPKRKKRRLPKTSLVKKFGIKLTEHIPEDVIQSPQLTSENMEIEIENLNNN